VIGHGSRYPETNSKCRRQVNKCMQARAKVRQHNKYNGKLRKSIYTKEN
jgi:hypothetical protein